MILIFTIYAIVPETLLTCWEQPPHTIALAFYQCLMRVLMLIVSLLLITLIV